MRAARAGRRIVMRPTEHGFVGPLAGELEEYIRFKASMGRHGATRVRVLRSFDRHCLEHGAVRLERGVVERWIAHRIDANPGGCRSWFSYIRDFGRWMRLACLCSISCCGLGVVTFCWTSLSVWSLVSVPDGFRRRARAGCVCP